MHPLSDKDLDRMSREAAEQTDVGQSPSGWEQLEGKLNKELPVQKDKDRKRFLWLFFLFLLLSGSGLVWMLNKHDIGQNRPVAAKNNAPSVADNTETSPVKPATTAANQAIPEVINEKAIVDREKKENKRPDNAQLAKNNDIDEDNDVIPAPSAGQGSGVTNDVSTKHKRFGKGIDSRSKNKSPKTSASGTASSKRDQQPGRKSASIAAAEPKSNDLNQPPSIVKLDEPANRNSEPAAEPNMKKTDDAKKLNSPLADSTPASISSQSESKKKPATNKGKDAHWTFGILAGMDKSRVEGTKADKPGYSFGAQVSYEFNKRWSVNSGLIYTTKNYNAKGEAFTKPAGSWLSYVDLKSINGDCYMWEVPVNVRFNITTNPKARLFASAGLSTYLMQKQAYTYHYDYNGAYTVRDWETKENENEWFKIANISAGFEHSFNRNWSVQVEPYARIPLSGIGYGQMDISSYGILVGIKYHLKK